MKKIKLFLCIALFGAMSFGAFSAYEHYTMNEEERFLLANIEALTNGEGTSAGTPCFGTVQDTNDDIHAVPKWETYCGSCKKVLGLTFSNPSNC